GGLDIPISQAGQLISGYALGVVVGAPLLTALATRLPRKPVLIGFMALFVVGNIATFASVGFEAVLASRVIAGLPHGAFLGAAALAAAQMAGPRRRATAVSRMMMGLTVANIVGVPIGTLLGQSFGWGAAFGVVALLGVVSMIGIAMFVPRLPSADGVRLRHEVKAMGNPQVLLGLATAVFGFGGVFAVYSYISPMMTQLAGMSDNTVPLVLALFGIGMTLGSLIVGPLADRWLRPTIYGGIAGLAVVLALFALTVHNPWTAAITAVVLGAVGFGVTAPLQVLIMNRAGHAPTLASASNHSAFNLANAGGAWLGGLGISAGLGYVSPTLIGAALALIGLALAVTAGILDARPASRPAEIDDVPTQTELEPALAS
ncbi:MAG: MFS transporter, partial [Stackebrandtia sp.]